MAVLFNIFAGIILLCIVLAGSYFLAQHTTSYRITSDSVEIRLFRKWRVWHASFQEIRDIRRISFWESMFNSSLHFMSRPFSRYVLIERHRGVFRSVLITPDEPEEFVKSVKEKVGFQ